MNNENLNNFSFQKNPEKLDQNHNEKEVEREILKLEENIQNLQKEIEEIGGEEKLTEEIKKNDLLADRWTNRYKRTQMLITSIALIVSTSVIGIGDAHILPQINWEIGDDKQLAETLIACTVAGFLGSIAMFVEYVRRQKIVKENDRVAANL